MEARNTCIAIDNLESVGYFVGEQKVKVRTAAPVSVCSLSSGFRMLNNFAFTLYEIFGYLLPGSLSFLAVFMLYWTAFGRTYTLGISGLKPSAVSWIAVVVVCYVLGHAMQAIGNLWSAGVESLVLDLECGTAPAWLRVGARQAATELVNAAPQERFEAKWLFRLLDEYALQNGRPGDREMFVYREGFYRGLSPSLFFLSGALVVRMVVPGASVLLASGVFRISFWEFLVTSGVLALIGCLLKARYRRFAEYRVTRAVLSAVVLRTAKADLPPKGSS